MKAYSNSLAYIDKVPFLKRLFSGVTPPLEEQLEDCDRFNLFLDFTEQGTPFFVKEDGKHFKGEVPDVLGTFKKIQKDCRKQYIEIVIFFAGKMTEEKKGYFRRVCEQMRLRNLSYKGFVTLLGGVSTLGEYISTAFKKNNEKYF